MSKDCSYNEDAQVNVAAEQPADQGECNSNDEQHLLMAFSREPEPNILWFLDLGCSNHMTGSKMSFVELDENFKMSVQLGNKKTLPVEGKGVV